MIKNFLQALLLELTLLHLPLAYSQVSPETFKPDARSIGLGGSLVTQVRDPSAIFWNPAALTGLKARSVLLSSNDPFEFSLASVSQFVPLYGTFALGLSRIPKMTDDVERGTVAWGRNFAPRFAIGAGVEMERSKGDWFASASWGVLLGNPTIGTLERPWSSVSSSRIWDRLSLGLTIRNVPLTNQVFETSALFGLSYLFPSARILLNTGYHVNEGEDTSHLGLGLEIIRNLSLFAGVEELDADRVGIGLGYSYDNFIVSMAYSNEFNKLYVTLSTRISPAPGRMARPHYRRGIEAVRTGNYERASHEFKKYLAYQTIDSKTDSVKRIVYVLDRRVKHRKMTIDSLFVVARNYLSQNDPQFLRAALVLTRIRELDPENRKAIRRLQSLRPVIDVYIKKAIDEGISEFESNRYVKAKKKFQKALMFDKEEPTALYYVETIDKIRTDMGEEFFYRGIGYYEQENYTRARQEFEQAIDSNPELDEARKYLNRTVAKIQERKDRIAQLLQKGQDLETQKDYVAAVNAYLEVVELDKKNTSAKAALARLRPRIDSYLGSLYVKAMRHYNKGEFESAGRIMSRILSIDPQHRLAKRGLSSLKEKERENLSFYLANADSAYRRGDWQAAVAMYDVALEIEPANKKAIQGKKAVEKKREISDMVAQARTKYEQGRYAEAAALYERLLQMEPENQAIRAALDRTQREINTLVETHYNRGIDYFTRDDYVAAIAELKKVLALQPDHSGALEYVMQAEERIQALKSLK